MKKILYTSVLIFAFFIIPVKTYAQEVNQEIICPEPYGGGVVCGIHTPVNTAVGDNIPAVAAGFFLTSGVLFFLYRKFKPQD